MKKFLLTLMTAATVFAAALGFTACTPDQSVDKFEAITSAKEAYGFSAATAGTLISSMNSGSAATLAQANSVALRTQVTDEETIAQLNEYMALVESLLSDGAFNMQEEVSERPEYAIKVTVSYKDLTGNTLSYTMYYNEEAMLGHDTDHDDDHSKDENNFSIRGILIIDGTEYEVLGEKETETSAKESETETKFTVALSETRTMRVKHSVESEQGEEEQEFSYSIYEGTQLLERSSFKYEQEDGETEIKFSLTKDGETQTFRFEKEIKNGKEVIVIRTGDKDRTEKYRVTIETNENGESSYVYEYAGKKIPMHRHED